MTRALNLFAALLVFTGALLFAPGASAQIALDEDGKLTLFGDVRLRAFEQDWDSLRSDGSPRNDRARLRVRARLGMNWKPIDLVTIGFRLRTGRHTAQQSPHLTFWDLDGNGNDPFQLVFDRLFVELEKNDTVARFGRHGDPFWKQIELFWNNDVSLTGATFRQRWDGESSDFQLIGGAYLLPDGMEAFAGNLLAGQLVYERELSSLTVTAASGLFFIGAADRTENLRNGNGTRDYKFWTASGQARLSRWGRPLRLGFDLMQNFQDYSPNDPDPFTAANHDQQTGYVGSAVFGNTLDRGDWLLGYWYAHIETFAVNASFAQDNWLRWGNLGQTDSSDFQGHELRFAIAINPDLNVVARQFFVKAITSVQDGKRFRLDFNYRF